MKSQKNQTESILQIEDNDIPRYRTFYAKKNRYICPICKQSMVGKKMCLDHCHDTGRLRDTICHNCNQAEGRIKGAIVRYNRTDSWIRRNYITWLRNLLEYWEEHKDKPKGVIHPSFCLKEGRQIKQIRRKRKPK